MGIEAAKVKDGKQQLWKFTELGQLRFPEF